MPRHGLSLLMLVKLVSAMYQHRPGAQTIFFEAPRLLLLTRLAYQLVRYRCVTDCELLESRAGRYFHSLQPSFEDQGDECPARHADKSSGESEDWSGLVFGQFLVEGLGLLGGDHA